MEPERRSHRRDRCPIGTPEVFDGASSDPEYWLNHFSRYVAYSRLNEDEQLNSRCFLFPESMALDCYDNLGDATRSEMCSLLAEFKDHRQRISRFVTRRYLEKINTEETFLPFTIITNKDYFPRKKNDYKLNFRKLTVAVYLWS